MLPLAACVKTPSISFAIPSHWEKKNIKPFWFYLSIEDNKIDQNQLTKHTLKHFKSPRKAIFRLKILHWKSRGNHGLMPAKSINFQCLVFIPNTEITTYVTSNINEKY